MNLRLALTLASLVAPLLVSTAAEKGVWPPPKPTKHDYAKWEKDITAFEAADKKNPAPTGAVLFAGSSTIVRWKTLAQDLPGVTVLNRGFGGNQIKDSTYYAERMIFPYEPRAIVLRAGGNDINAGWPVEEVFNDYKAFVAKMRSRFPQIPIYYIGLTPTIRRREQVEAGDKLNALIAAYCKANRGLTYIDARDVSLDRAGQIRPDVFVADMLHFKEEGYKLLAARVRPIIPKDQRK
jgi:lysophospholipase L1-like esterase